MRSKGIFQAAIVTGIWTFTLEWSEIDIYSTCVNSVFVELGDCLHKMLTPVESCNKVVVIELSLLPVEPMLSLQLLILFVLSKISGEWMRLDYFRHSEKSVVIGENDECYKNHWIFQLHVHKCTRTLIRNMEWLSISCPLTHDFNEHCWWSLTVKCWFLLKKNHLLLVNFVSK